MLKAGSKFVFSLIAVLALSTCIDPYSPKLKGYKSLLVVDGLITDANTSYTVKLSTTIQEQNITPSTVSDAAVFITDDAGNNFNLNSWGNGIYKTDSIKFTGIIGRTYTLHIITQEGNEYVSDPCSMLSVPDIDSVYYARDQELVNNETESQEGIMIYLDSKAGDNNQYYRWGFEETWKFRVPDPKKYDYINGYIVPVAQVKEYCWKSIKSDIILVRSVLSGAATPVKKEPIFFIASNKSDRLMSEYSILIKQYSISRNEYEFWDNLKRVNESGADIFASQPFPVISNIHNINNPNEMVLGYFQVSAVKQKRLFIPFSEFVRLHLPFYHYDDCERIEKAPSDYATQFGPPVTFDDLYSLFCIKSDYVFIEPVYNSVTNALEKLVFTTPECADCELTGTSNKPDFWIDLN
jgi:Domain of unknown function (DUF4249)